MWKLQVELISPEVSRLICISREVLDIVGGYFTELPLQSHLQILANSIASQLVGESGSGAGAAREGKGHPVGSVMSCIWGMDWKQLGYAGRFMSSC